MARTSSSKNVSAPTAPYRLRLPPAGRPISPIAVVARGRRTSLQPRSCFATSPSSPTPTEPDSPSAPLQEKQGLKCTYSFLRPTYATPFDANTVVPPAANPNHHQHTSSHSITVPQHEAHSAAPTHAGTMTELSPPSTPVQHTPANQPNDIYSSPVESSPITGIELGLRGLFRSIDTTVLPIFEAPMQFDDFVYLKLQLENPDGGLTPFQFCNMFGMCRGCDKFMVIRSKDQHRCPGKNALPSLAPRGRLLSLLDSTHGGQGVTRNQLDQLFASCITCGLIFTRGIGAYHFHTSEEYTHDSS